MRAYGVALSFMYSLIIIFFFYFVKQDFIFFNLHSVSTPHSFNRSLKSQIPQIGSLIGELCVPASGTTLTSIALSDAKQQSIQCLKTNLQLSKARNRKVSIVSKTVSSKASGVFQRHQFWLSKQNNRKERRNIITTKLSCCFFVADCCCTDRNNWLQFYCKVFSLAQSSSPDASCKDVKTFFFCLV